MNTAEKIAETYLRLNGFFTLPQFTLFIKHGVFEHIDIIAVRMAGSCELVEDMPMQVDNEFFDQLSALIPENDARNVLLPVAAEVKSNEEKQAPKPERLEYLKSFYGGLEPIGLSFRKMKNGDTVTTDNGVVVVAVQHCINWIVERIEWMKHERGIAKSGSWNWSEPFLADILVLHDNGHLKSNAD
jgi:hypothetical protein